MRMSMVDGLGGVNTRQRALRAKRLANLGLHCRRLELVPGVPEWWGRFARGPQLCGGVLTY